MKKIFSAVALILLLILPVSNVSAAITSSVVRAEIVDQPILIFAPSISLFSPIEGVGIDQKGNMDVPSGKTNKVGWYKYGVVPGMTGTAVLDAHVFAAFRDLHKLEPGSSIYVLMQSGKFLRFMVTAINTYALDTLSPYTLFAPSETEQLNLITCAGRPIDNNANYDHRLIVSAIKI